MKSKGFLSLVVLVAIGLLVYFFRADDDPPPIPQEPRAMGLAETGLPPVEQKRIPAPATNIPSAEPRTADSVEDSLLTSDRDREAWRNCVGGDIPREQDSLEAWAQGQSAEPPTVHWSNVHFRDAQGRETRIRYLIDDGPDEKPLPRLQMFSVDAEGNPGDVLRQENMDYETARESMSNWMGGEAPFYQERSMTFYFEDGEATIEIENDRTRSITVTQGAAILICSFRGTAAGHRCTCKGSSIEEDSEEIDPTAD